MELDTKTKTFTDLKAFLIGNTTIHSETIENIMQLDISSALTLIELVFESNLIENCEPIFDKVQQKLGPNSITNETDKRKILKIFLSLFKRTEKGTFAGKILIFLARLFPINEISGLNKFEADSEFGTMINVLKETECSELINIFTQELDRDTVWKGLAKTIPEIPPTDLTVPRRSAMFEPTPFDISDSSNVRLSLQSMIEPLKEQMMPENDIEKAYRLSSSSTFNWKVLRLARNSHLKTLKRFSGNHDIEGIVDQLLNPEQQDLIPETAAINLADYLSDEEGEIQ